MPHAGSTKIPTVPEPLVRAVANERAVLFAGAGTSLSEPHSGGRPDSNALPDWKGLLQNFTGIAGERGLLSDDDVRELGQAIEARKFLFVAETVRQALGKAECIQLLKAIFADERLRITPRHELITEIPFAGVLTCNYDNLLEQAYQRLQSYPVVLFSNNGADVINLLACERSFILKAHGDPYREESIVLTERDYRAIHRQPGYISALQTIFLTRTVLFIGTSLNDPDFRLILETINEVFGGRIHSHYALVPGDGVGKKEIQYWKEFFGIHLLPYQATPGHPQVDQFLEDLKQKVKLTRPPDQWGNLVLEAKWYPSPDTFQQIRKDIETQDLGLTDYESAFKASESRSEANVLFDTDNGSLYWGNVNLSIKVIAIKEGGQIVRFSAYWKLTKLVNYGDRPDRIWKRRETNGQERHFTPSGSFRNDLKKIIKELTMDHEIVDTLEREEDLSRTDVDPIVLIAVQRQTWGFRSKSSLATTLNLQISSVNIYPHSEQWLDKLPSQFDPLDSTSFDPTWSWRELEIEEQNSSETSGPKDYLARLSNFEQKYNLDAPRSYSGPIAKYHSAVERLRRFSISDKAKSDPPLLTGWAQFLKMGDA